MKQILLLFIMLVMSCICRGQALEQDVSFEDSISVLTNKLVEVKKDSERVNIYKGLVDMLGQENAKLSDIVAKYEQRPDLLLLTDEVSVFNNNVPIDEFSCGLRAYAKAIDKVKGLKVALQNMNDVLATSAEVMRKDRSLDYNGFLNTQPVQDQLQELVGAATMVDEIDRDMFSDLQTEYIDSLLTEHNKLLLEIYQ